MEYNTDDNTIFAYFSSIGHSSEYHCNKNLRCYIDG